MLNLHVDAPKTRLDGTTTRRFTMDRAGVIYDVITDSFIGDNPFVRVSRHLPWKFFVGTSIGSPGDVWPVDTSVKQRLSEYLSRIFSFWTTGNGPKNKALGSVL